jgi:hypothetical protein
MASLLSAGDRRFQVWASYPAPVNADSTEPMAQL